MIGHCGNATTPRKTRAGAFFYFKNYVAIIGLFIRQDIFGLIAISGSMSHSHIYPCCNAYLSHNTGLRHKLTSTSGLKVPEYERGYLEP